MATTERVTVRMSRGDPNTPWGFRLQGGQEYGSPLSIGKVLEGSLADRAGLHEGDKLLDISRANAQNLSHQGAQDAILRSGNTMDLVVERLASRSWKPFVPPIEFPAESGTTVTQTSSVSRPFGQPQQNSNYSTSSRSVVSEHHTSGGGGHNKPSTTTADQYLHQTGGLFGTDPKLTAPASKEEPSYLRSQTLRMIKESESHTGGGGGGSGAPRASPQPASGGIPPPISGSAPACDNCGRMIHGVFCKAGGKTMHGDCFKCATCGGSLKNVGYFLINGKLFCDIHARQQQENPFKAAPPVDPNLFHSYPAAGSLRPIEPPKAFYQPAILNKGPVSVPVPNPNSFSPGGGGSNDYSSNNYQYRKTTKTTSSTTGGQDAYNSGAYNQQQQHHQPPSWEQPMAPPPPSQPLLGSPRAAQSYGGGGGAPSPRSTSYNMDRSMTTSTTKSSFGPGRQPAAGARAPRRGRGILKQLHEAPRIPVCESCNREIRGPFVLALNKTWCPDHFVCATQSCNRKLLDIGFVEENGSTHCEFCYEKYLAPPCSKCSRSVVGDCLTALGRQWHPECFVCSHCHRSIGNSAFYMENGQPFCENDWNTLFTTKCVSCQFAIDPGDRWVEALGNSYHSECFSCSVCQKNLEGQSFFAKGGRPYCKSHA